MAGSTFWERFLGIKLQNEMQDTRFLTCLWQGASSRGLVMREINPSFWGNSAQAWFLASLLGSTKAISVYLWSFLREGIMAVGPRCQLHCWSGAMPHSSKPSRPGTPLPREEWDLTLAFHAVQATHPRSPFATTGPIRAPHDPEEINAFEQNLISIQRLYLCQEALAKETGRELVGTQCWQLLEQGLVVWKHGQDRRLAETTMLQQCPSLHRLCLHSSFPVTSDALRGLVSPRAQLLM